MPSPIINSAMKDPAAELDAAATQAGGQQRATPTGIINSAAQPAVSTQTAAPATATATGTTQTTPPAPAHQASEYKDQIGALYQNLLGRSADQGGLDFFGGNIANGSTDLSGVEGALINSDEYKALHAPKPAPPPASVSGYTAAQLGDPTKWNVTGEQTVAGQIKQILDANSPIIQQARAMGLAGANDRGLLNSSIGESAGLDAAYKSALQIATPDAATYARAAGYNADESNQFAVHNVDARNDASKANLSAQTQMAIANLQAQTQTNLGYLDATTKTNLANMSNENQIKLATIEAQYHTIMQSSASASDLFRQVTQNITTISQSKDMDAAAKQQAVDNQLQMLKSAMQTNGAISNLNLGDLLNFSTTPFPDAGASTQPLPVTQGGLQVNAGGLANGVINQARGV